MRITRTAVYNVYGLSGEDKSILFNALTEYAKRFGETEPRGQDIARLIAEFSPTDEAHIMDRKESREALDALCVQFRKPSDKV